MKATRQNYNLYNTRLRTRAQALRNKMTKAEACLWKYALKSKLTGYTFNRQRPVMNYIADFMCKDLRLIIEVDGLSHTVEKIIAKDIIRQETLEKAGFKLIRFTDDKVLKSMQSVRTIISQTIEQLEAERKKAETTSIEQA